MFSLALWMCDYMWYVHAKPGTMKATVANSIFVEFKNTQNKSWYFVIDFTLHRGPCSKQMKIVISMDRVVETVDLTQIFFFRVSVCWMFEGIVAKKTFSIEREREKKKSFAAILWAYRFDSCSCIQNAIPFVIHLQNDFDSMSSSSLVLSIRSLYQCARIFHTMGWKKIEKERERVRTSESVRIVLSAQHGLRFARNSHFHSMPFFGVLLFVILLQICCRLILCQVTRIATVFIIFVWRWFPW